MASVTEQNPADPSVQERVEQRAAEREKLRMGDSELLKVNLRTSYYAKALIQEAQAQRELGMMWAEWLSLSAGF